MPVGFHRPGDQDVGIVEEAAVALSPVLRLLRHGCTASPGRPGRESAAAAPFLGFTLDWEHQFEPGMPLYVQISRSAAVLHLSGHHGDGAPNSVVCIPVRDVSALHKELLARPKAPARPGTDPDAPGGPTLQFLDPYGTILRFAQPPSGQ